MEASELDDFITYDGNVMTATPEGYYVIQKDFLYYISPDFQSSTAARLYAANPIVSTMS